MKKKLAAFLLLATLCLLTVVPGIAETVRGGNSQAGVSMTYGNGSNDSYASIGTGEYIKCTAGVKYRLVTDGGTIYDKVYGYSYGYGTTGIAHIAKATTEAYYASGKLNNITFASVSKGLWAGL